MFPKTRIIAIGKMKDARLRELLEDYLKRLQRGGNRPEMVELKDIGDVAQESTRIKEALTKAKGAHSFILTEEGKTMDSQNFAHQLQSLAEQSCEAVFVIGGPYGMDASLKAKADTLISLSPMTFTHEWARVLLAEQLYRAQEILRGSGYHH